MLGVPISPVQKVADDKVMKAKKVSTKGKKEDGPAQNGEAKTNEVRGDPRKELGKNDTMTIFLLFLLIVVQIKYIENTCPATLHTHLLTHTLTHTRRSMCLVRLSACHPSEARHPPWCQCEGRVWQSELRVCSTMCLPCFATNSLLHKVSFNHSI